MAKYQKYAEYKDSGIEWLGEIPSHWTATALKRYSRITDGSHHSPKIEIEGFPFVSVTDVGINNINFFDAKKITETDYLRLVKEGCKPAVNDVLLTKDGTIGRACIVTEDMPDFVILSSLGLITPNKEISSHFLYYYLVSGINVDQMNSVIHGSALKRMTINKINDLILTFPDFYEQEKIASFLDHETAKIDTLIAKQEKLIELLKEKRQAVISHAVTKGLNPDVKLKDSGVEWLGQVPEHWGVSRLKNIIRSLESGCSVNAADIPAQSNELGVLKTSCVYTRSFRIEENKTVVPEDIHRVKCKVRKGAIIISRMNTPELVGASALVKVEADNIYLPDRLWQTIFFENIDIDAEYLSHFMTVQGFRDQIALGAEGASSSMQNIAKEDYLNINCLVPPLEEQIQIRAFIEQKLAVLSNLNMKAQEAVERLKERRTALISSAVTGKIDVRNWQHPNEAKTEFSA
ncbi:MAG: restriction endonuclease subunit S [Acinetobacter sp.]|uniref:restriction endonuclease subunit S n=1 Tax=Acinetobacter sp. YH01006 TaxID=2601022 RepID=UPI0015D46A0E|nr:restriction endonuclease subunit S [Acinetobacter sp. YH01006]MBP6114439.1 restriction endonuclease subunit S [Acinetobacter sp.]